MEEGKELFGENNLINIWIGFIKIITFYLLLIFFKLKLKENSEIDYFRNMELLSQVYKEPILQQKIWESQLMI
jgi:hypothetical protein